MTMRVHRDVVLATTVDETWQLLTDPDELAAWLGTPTTLDLRPGGMAAYVEPDGTVRHAVVEHVERHDDRACLAFVWWDAADPRPDAVATRVVFELTATDAGTRVDVTETRASVAGASVRVPFGAFWDDRLFDLERHSLTRQFALV